MATDNDGRLAIYVCVTFAVLALAVVVAMFSRRWCHRCSQPEWMAVPNAPAQNVVIRQEQRQLSQFTPVTTMPPYA